MNKKIAYLVSEYPAPSHTFIRREIQALRHEGICIVPISINRPAGHWTLGKADKEEQKETVYIRPVRALPFLGVHLNSFLRSPLGYIGTLSFALRHRAPGMKNLVWSLFYFAEAVILAGEIRKKEIGHIHNHFANASANVGLFASKLAKIPWSLTLHGLADWTYPNGNTLPQKLVHAEFVACVSHYGRAQAFRVSPPDIWKKMFIARCGVDLERIATSRREKRDKGRFRIVTIGRLSPEKGHSGLIEAFSETVKRGLDAELVIGGGGGSHGELKRLIRKRGVEERCCLLGQLTEVQVFEEMGKSDLFVLSSFMEGLPVVLMEALALEIPVIAPCVAGIPELVIHGKTGALFIPGDWKDLSEKILDMANNRSIAANEAAAGHQLVEDEFEIGKAVKPLLERYRDRGF